MSVLSPLHSSAVAILQNAVRPHAAAGGRETAPGPGLVAVANGVQDAGVSAGATQQAKAKVSEALFKPNSPSVTEMKLHLMKRLGEEFGIKLEDHDSHASFGRAIRSAIDDIRWSPSGVLKLAAVEKKLGFDELGFSLDTFVNAIIDSEGSDAKRVDAAIREHLGQAEADSDDAEDARRALKALLRFDESGLYGPVHN